MWFTKAGISVAVGEATAASSFAGVQAPYVMSPVAKFTFAGRVNSTVCSTTFCAPVAGSITGFPSSYTYLIVRFTVSVVFRSLTDSGYFGPLLSPGTTG